MVFVGFVGLVGSMVNPSLVIQCVSLVLAMVIGGFFMAKAHQVALSQGWQAIAEQRAAEIDDLKRRQSDQVQQIALLQAQVSQLQAFNENLQRQFIPK